VPEKGTEDTKERRDSDGKGHGKDNGERGGTATRPRSGPADGDCCFAAVARLGPGGYNGRGYGGSGSPLDRLVRGW